jgi:hypothetical protein
VFSNCLHTVGKDTTWELCHLVSNFLDTTLRNSMESLQPDQKISTYIPKKCTHIILCLMGMYILPPFSPLHEERNTINTRHIYTRYLWLSFVNLKKVKWWKRADIKGGGVYSSLQHVPYLYTKYGTVPTQLDLNKIFQKANMPDRFCQYLQVGNHFLSQNCFPMRWRLF